MVEGLIKANSFIYGDVSVSFFSKVQFTDVWVIELKDIANEGSMVVVSCSSNSVTVPTQGSLITFCMSDSAKGLACT